MRIPSFNRRLVLPCACVALVLLAAAPALAQPAAATQPGAPDLPAKWEELTSPDFVKAVERAGRTVIVPLGIVEKHGPHLPLGTDLLNARELALRAAAREYALVFPPYYVGQIFEAKHQPGTLAYSERLIWDLLQETVDELGRNGITKIVLVNGHGGNTNFLRYFCQAQLARRRPYAVYLFQPSADPELDAKVKALRKTTMEAHAGETETARMMAHRPDLAHSERAGAEPGVDLAHLDGLKDLYTGIWWYARFPNHYAGDGAPATAELGRLLLDASAAQLAAAIKAVKADTRTLELQQQFFGEAEAPLATVPKE
jgi:creatinine amidohydrolase